MSGCDDLQKLLAEVNELADSFCAKGLTRSDEMTPEDEDELEFLFKRMIVIASHKDWRGGNLVKDIIQNSEPIILLLESVQEQNTVDMQLLLPKAEAAELAARLAKSTRH